MSPKPPLILDDFYDYRDFSDSRLDKLLKGWDGLGGNHGSAIKFCANLLVGNSILDVGCGLCHLYEVLKPRIEQYIGIDIDDRIIKWAKERYPQLDLYHANSQDLSILGDKRVDTVFAIGLYRRINEFQSLNEFLKRAKKAIVVTYLHRVGSEPRYFPDVLWEVTNDESVSSLELFNHKIKALEIVRFNIRNEEK